MTVPTREPPERSWIVAIHATSDDFEPIGTGIVLDPTRVLTSAHVVISLGEVHETVWVAFPMSAQPEARSIRSAEIRVASHSMADLAVIRLEEPVPAGVTPGPLRCPQPGHLAGLEWWAFGFARADALGSSASGTIGTSLGYGWIRLDTESRYHVEPGFSGGGMWCPEYNAVVAVVGEANSRGDGRAITLHHADRYLPDEGLRLLTRWSVAESDDVAKKAWGWSLSEDQEADRHWTPRARGVSVQSERGYRFRGRAAALSAAVTWLDRSSSDRKVLIVTGSPGVGKSAVLGRLVTTADPRFRSALPPEDAAHKATAGSIACAVHAKGKRALDVAMEIARAASAPIPERVDDLPGSLRKVLGESGETHFNIVIDALDEASDAEQARVIATQIAMPIAIDCAGVGAQVLIGTRRADDSGDIVSEFGPAASIIDLDAAEFFDIDDLAAYALVTLQLTGDERTGNPYEAQPAEAVPVAKRIAELADQNFLIAALVARTHGLYDSDPISPDEVEFTPSVDATLSAFIDKITPAGGVDARSLLAALAFAETPGFTLELWRLATLAVSGEDVPLIKLRRFVSGSAANFLVESTGRGARWEFRLFHKALSDSLRKSRRRHVAAFQDESAIVESFHSHGSSAGWEFAPPYLFRSLPAHAQRANKVDKLLTDVEYVLHADLRRLIPATAHAESPAARDVAHLLRMTPRAMTAGPGERLAMLSVTETLHQKSLGYQSSSRRSPYRGIWASVPKRAERLILIGHTGRVTGVHGFRSADQDLLASVAEDGTVRIWDADSGATEQVLRGHAGSVLSVCAVEDGGRTVIATGGSDGAVQIWNPTTGSTEHAFRDHTSAVSSVAALATADGPVVFSGGNDGKIRAWNVRSRTQQFVAAAHDGWVRDLCVVNADGSSRLVSAGGDGLIRVWDAISGERLLTLRGHRGRVNGVCAVSSGGRSLIASVSNDKSIWIWDPVSGAHVRSIRGSHQELDNICVVPVDGRQVLLAGGQDNLIRAWDLDTGRLLHSIQGHLQRVNALCVVRSGHRYLLASASRDWTVRVWDLTSFASEEDGYAGHGDTVNSVCAVEAEEGHSLVSGSSDGTVRVWTAGTSRTLRYSYDPYLYTEESYFTTLADPSSRRPRSRTLGSGFGGRSEVRGVCSYRSAGQRFVVSCSDSGRVLLHRLDNAGMRELDTQTNWRLNSMCTVPMPDGEQLAVSADSGNVLIWDAPPGGRVLAHGSRPSRLLQDHAGIVYGVCSVVVRDRSLLATAGDDGFVRLWNTSTGRKVRTLGGHQGRVTAVCAVGRSRQVLASGGADHNICVWDPRDGSMLGTMVGHDGPINDLCELRAGGRDLVASASQDHTLRVWDAASGQQLLTIPAPSPVMAVTAFSTSSLLLGLATGVIAIEISL